MVNKIKTRDNNLYLEKESKINVFLYKTYFGRFLLKVFINPFISKIIGCYFNSKISKIKIKKFILKNSINMDEYKDDNFKCFNDFFGRKIKEDRRTINQDNSVLISPCDAKLSVYKIDDNVFKIKNSYYHLNDLVDNNIELSYKNGYAFVFRLTVDDYHRYSFIDDGDKDDYHKIDGVLHTVRPISQDRYPIYVQNSREWCILHTKNFGDVIQIEVGALLVGKIVNHDIKKFKRGEEKGFFKFGGSTIVLFVNNVDVDLDIINNSNEGIETVIKLGEKIGKKK